MTLEPMHSDEAVQQYLASRKIDVTEETLQSYRYRLEQFLRWADEVGLDDMNELTGRMCNEFKNWRVVEGGLSRVTLEQHLLTFRDFVRWCESNDAVAEGTAEKIIVPRVSRGEAARDEAISPDRAKQIIDFLARFEFASRDHIIFHILWHTGMRMGALHALDVRDWYSDDPHFRIRHRPDTGTPLKLKERGERNVSIVHEDLVTAIEDYIETQRPDVTDEYGREPLIATRYGRVQKSTIRTAVYRVTRPCYYTGECPHDREIPSCEATERDYFAKCPSSLSPHPIRRGSITYHLNSGVPKEHVSTRTNVSQATLEEHYDARTLEDRRFNRGGHLDNV